jgi:amidase
VHHTEAEFPSALNAYLSDELEESPVRSLQELIDWNTAHSEIELPAGKGDQSHLISAAATTSDAAEITAMRDKLRGQAATLALDPLFSNLSLPPINHHHHHNKPTTATTKAKEEEEEREENHRYRLDALLGPADSALPDYAAAAGYAIATLPLGRFHPRLGRPGANGGGRPYGLVAIGAPGADGLRRLVKVASAWEASWQARAVPDLEGLPHRRTV